MDYIAEVVKSCTACQAATRETTGSLTTRTRKQASRTISSSEYLLVDINNYSRFPGVETVNSTFYKLESVILKLNPVFECQLMTEIVKSDNGPPFNSK